MKFRFSGILFLLLLVPLGAQTAPPGVFTIHYHREDQDYEEWTAYVWGNQLNLGQPISWGNSLPPDARDDFGVIWRIPLKPAASRLSFILHKGEQKNTPEDMNIILSRHGYEVWVLSGDKTIYTSRPPLASDPPPVKPQEPAAAPVATAAPQPESTPSPATPGVPSGTPRTTAPRSSAPAPVPVVPEITVKTITTLAEALAREKELNQAVQTLEQNKKSLEEALGEARNRQVTPEMILGTTLGFLALALAGLAGWILLILKTKQIARLEKEREESSKSAVQEAESRMMQKTIMDELTGLPNRAGLNQVLPVAINKAKRYKKQLGLLFIDLDHFKPINDTLGHDAGDYVLRTIAERFKECLRASDLICRLGGDEFVIVVDELSDSKFLAGIAQKILTAAQQGFIISGQEVHVSASIGIACYPMDGRDAASLLKNADAAMYKAKEGGKNNFHYFSTEQNTHALQRMALASSLENALERNEFTLVYQPVVQTGTENIQSLEALVRWNHKDLGSVAPSQFIPLAEDIGLMPKLSFWILSNALRQVRRWLAAGRRTQLSVNITSKTLYQSGFVEEVKLLLDQTGFPPSSLCLEISEEALLVNQDEAMERLQDLKDLGVNLTVDNFGVGYASLVYLRRFPVDGVKTDRTLLSGIPGDQENESLLETILAAGKNFGLKVVACGVETPEQEEYMSRIGCPLIQGFHIARPASAEEMSDLWK